MKTEARLEMYRGCFVLFLFLVRQCQNVTEAEPKNLLCVSAIARCFAEFILSPIEGLSITSS
jgi:hypothetical protein